MFELYPKWQGKQVRPSRSADKEIRHLCIDLDYIVKILEDGYDCPRSKRKVGTIERCYKTGKKIIKVVVVKSVTQWNSESVWLITHVGD